MIEIIKPRPEANQGLSDFIRPVFNSLTELIRYMDGYQIELNQTHWDWNRPEAESESSG